jgi:methionyl aminopeptidase
MINIGTWKDQTWKDNWTSTTVDGQRSAQFEHTMIVTDDGVDVLTKRLPNSPELEFWKLLEECEKLKK